MSEQREMLHEVSREIVSKAWAEAQEFARSRGEGWDYATGAFKSNVKSEIAALLRRIQRQWMPIESAPMNGRWILVWWPKASKIPFTAYYDYQNKRWMAAPNGGSLDKHSHRTMSKSSDGPIYWQSIPKPPTENADV